MKKLLGFVLIVVFFSGCYAELPLYNRFEGARLYPRYKKYQKIERHYYTPRNSYQRRNYRH
jgi:hypothetical protein